MKLYPRYVYSFQPIFIAAALFAGINEGLLSHDLWLERSPGVYIVRYGHIRPDAKDEISLSLDRKGISRGICVRGSARTALLFEETGGIISTRGTCDAVALEYHGGYFTKTTDGTVRLPRNQAHYPIKSWLSFEYVKRIDAWTDQTSRPLGVRLEITPDRDITKLKTGDKVTLIVTANGAPAPGVVLAVHDDPRGMTDSQGRVNVRIRETGTQVFQATQVIPLKRPDADEEIHTARIQFEVNQ